MEENTKKQIDIPKQTQTAQNVTVDANNEIGGTGTGKRDAPLLVEDGFKEYESASKKSRKTSDVWKEFEPKDTAAKGKGASSGNSAIITVICKHCKSDFISGPTYGTSHLKRHLQTCKAKRNTDITNYLIKGDPIVDGSNALKTHKYDASDIRKCILLFVVEGNHAFSLVEEPGFRRMMSRSNPQFSPFSRHTLKNELLAFYLSERDKLKQMMETAIGRICLTTDNWKNEHAREEYICVTAHFIDKNWKLQKRILRFKVFKPPYGGIRVADELLLCMSHAQWNIEKKIFTITTDNASYNDTMISNLQSNLNRKNYLLKDGDFLQVRCCAHILNLIVQAGLDVIRSSLDKIREMVKCVYRSPSRAKVFFEIAEKVYKLETTRKFRLDMPIRWNSTYFMLDRVLYYKNALVHFAGRDHTMSSYALTKDEWENVNVIHKFLKVFYEVTCIFSAVKTPTSNLYFKGVWKIHKALLQVANGGPSILSDVVPSMQSKFDKYWSTYNEILSCACILDPRYKKDFLQFAFSKVYGKDECEYHVNKIMSALYSLFEEYKQPNGCDVGNLSNSGDNIDNMLNSDEADFSNYLSKKSVCSNESQLDLYLSEPIRDSKEHLDVLEFWNKSSMRYPELARMAADILCIPVSTVASESAFSIGGKIITSTRSSLKSKTIQAIVCLRDWVKAEGAKDVNMDDFDCSSEDDIDDGEEELDDFI